MRVSNQSLYMNSLYSMQNTTASLGDSLSKMSFGKSILKPSDDPIGAVQVLTVQREHAATDQYMKNIGAVSDSLSRNESHMSTMVDIQNRMREIVTAAGSGTTSAEDRQAYANELKQLQEAMVDQANAKDDKGNYIFSGNQTDAPAISKDASGNYVYGGDGNSRKVQVSDSTWIEANTPGSELFFSGGGDDIFNQLDDFITVLEDPTLTPGDAAFDGELDQMMDSLDDTLTSVTGAMTDIGGRQNSLSLMESSHQDMQLYSEQLIGEIEGLDYAEAVTEYETMLVALQVTQQSYVKISQLSLFNEL